MIASMTPTGQWLKNLQEEYRSFIRESSLYTSIAAASSAADLQWIRQLYYLSSDFTAAVALRYGSCQDSRFRDAFGEHAAEEVTHPADLAEWMREFGFLRAEEEPISVSPTWETLTIGSYLIRVVTRDPIPHQLLTLNLLAEGTACDFYSAVNPKLAELGLTPKGYWAVHAKADMRHEILGLDLIPQCDADSPLGSSYAHALRTTASFFRLVFDSWSGSQLEKLKVPIPEAET
jgi:hypothetical protein